MGPHCSSAKTQVCHRSYIIAAILDIVSDITSKDLVKINPSKSELVPLTKRHSDFSLRMDTEEIKQTTETIRTILISKIE